MLTSVAINNAFGQQVQLQSVAHNGARFIADDNTVPAQTAMVYDGLGRPTASEQ